MRIHAEHNLHHGAVHRRHRRRHQIVSSPSKNTHGKPCPLLSKHLTDIYKSRIAYLSPATPGEMCAIGMHDAAISLMLCVETLSELFLTLRFLFPLIIVHKRGNGLLPPLRKVVACTSIGSTITLLMDVAVKVSLILFSGEPTWLCYLACKAEAMFAAYILHWITSPVLSEAERKNRQPSSSAAQHCVESTGLSPGDTTSGAPGQRSQVDDDEVELIDLAKMLALPAVVHDVHSGGSKFNKDIRS